MLHKPGYRVNLKEIERDFPLYLRRVLNGETLVIVEDGKEIAEMNPSLHIAETPRPYGLCAGEFRVPDDFDSALPDDLIKDFEGK